jgi:XRE family transcriptional regulator, regulator of sulfur utilization
VKPIDEPWASHLSDNMRQLRDARRVTQAQAAKLAGIPRATWANLETGGANPTLAVLHRVASALQVTLEELIAAPRAAGRHYPRDTLPVRVRGEGKAILRRLLPDPLPGMELDRFELKPSARFAGVPHTPGTREYLTCETGELVLAVAGGSWTLAPGDVVVFRGDQRHSYSNPGRATAIGYSVVVLAPLI